MAANVKTDNYNQDPAAPSNDRNENKQDINDTSLLPAETQTKQKSLVTLFFFVTVVEWCLFFLL